MKSTCRVKARMLARRIWEKVYTIKKKSCESTNAFEMLKTQRVKGASSYWEGCAQWKYVKRRRLGEGHKEKKYVRDRGLANRKGWISSRNRD